MNNDFYITLIYKQLQDGLSSEEEQTLQEWENALESNQKLSLEIRRAWEAAAAHDLPFDLDHDAGFEAVQAKINTAGGSTEAKVVSMGNRRKWISIAAALAFLLVAVFVIRQYSTSTSVDWVAVTTTQDTQEISLPDGSTVWLNKNSSLSYPEQFAADSRQIKLEGEAFFEVQKNPAKPFEVQAKDLHVTVLGTAFNVRNSPTSKEALVSVREGKVRVTHEASPESLILTKAETAIYDKEQQQFKKEADRNLNATAWQRKNLRFSRTALPIALENIEQTFGIKIELDNPFMEDCTIGGLYDTKMGKMKVLKAIADLYKMKIHKVNDTEFLLVGGTCE